MSLFNDSEKKELLSLARRTIHQQLEGKSGPEPLPADSPFAEKHGVFVTLHRGDELRGCIGYPLPIKPLWEAVQDNALSAAFEDPRFCPMNKEELPQIDIEISVLTVPQEIEQVSKIQVGRDGIIVSKGFNRGLLLPQVPVEQGWNLEQYISYGCRKAGLPADEWKKGVRIEIFQAEVFGEKERKAEGG